MANEGTIASKLQLDGEQQYKKALNDAYRSLRVLRSELKAETAELGRNASEQDKARTKMASLQKQIQQQQQIVKTLEKALADSKKEYADNQEVQDKWAEKLNKARAALADMENSLGACEDGLSKFNDSMKETANASGQAVQTVVSFNDAMKSIGNIASTLGGAVSGIFTNTLDTMQDMVNGMISLMSMAWSAAGEWDQIQTIWGGDLASIEKVYTAMALQGIDASQVTSGIQKFITNVHNGNEDTLAALEQLHLSESQFASHWDFFVAVMNKASMFSGKEQYNLMTALFGDKKGAGMTDMLKNWREAMNRYQKDVEETGMELSSPELEKLNQVSHKITEIQEMWNVVKTDIGAKLNEILNMDKLSDDALNILRDIGAIFNSQGDSRKELVIKLEDDISSLLKDVSESLGDLGTKLKELGGDLKDSNNPLVSLLGKLIESLGGVLDWISTNSDTIVAWLNTLLPVMAVNKTSEALTGKGIGDWLTDLLNIGIDFAILGKLFGNSAGAALGATAGTFGAAIGAALLKAVPVLSFLYTLLNPGAGSDETGNNTLFDENGNPTNEFYAQGGTVGPNGEYIPYMIPEITGSNGLSLTSSQREAAEAFWDAFRSNPDFSDEEWEAFESAFAGQEELFETLNGKMDELVQGVPDDSWRELENLPSDWFQSISGALKNLSQDNYRGANDEDLPGRIATAVGSAVKQQPITVNVYVDGDKVTEGVNTRLGSLLNAGLFG